MEAPSPSDASAPLPNPETSQNGTEEDRADRFPIVGIGASAGGLRAFETFFQHLPKETGMAFVLIQHLAPHHESELAELLQNHTAMKVAQVEDTPAVQPNHVYVIPPGKSMTIRDGRLELAEPIRRRGLRLPIDHFFRSLADDQGERAVCIILSGTGSDGTLGLKAVKERAGFTMAQDPDDAEYDGMPRSAVQTGLVDIVGTPAELAERLASYRDHAGPHPLIEEADALPESDSAALDKIFAQLRGRTGHDFRSYKRSTVLRRIGRRMQVCRVEDLTAYLAYLREHADEAHALFKDLLISVTNFFRDPEAFEALDREVMPELFAKKGAGDQVRVWVPGCATGEEAYSIAMLLCEHAGRLEAPPSLQVFATDLDEDAIAFAREGLYPESIAVDMSPERLRRFFVEENSGYRVRDTLRDVVLFAPHNLIADPPFSRQDLVSCRNLLIYLNRDIQQQVFGVFHYALRPKGYLLLGSSESVDASGKLFEEVDKKRRIFRARHEPSLAPRFVTSFWMHRDEQLKKDGAKDAPKQTIEELYAAWTLKQHAPPRLLVDSEYDVTHVFGGAGRYLTDREGAVSQNVLQRVLPDLRPDLRAGLYRLFDKGESSETRALAVEVEGETRRVRLCLGAVDEPGFPADYAEVIFYDEGTPDAPEETQNVDGEAQVLVSRLEEELQRTRSRLQSTVEEQEAANEELKASNEELQSMNEELQSTTEELETSKEELQSMNEELVTVNQELKTKIEELSYANSDLQNLMASTEIGTIFLDRELCVKRFTPRIADLFHIIASDVGRPFAHIAHQIDHDALPELAQHVLDTLDRVEEEVRSRDGREFLVRIVPYRTLDDHIDGVVVTLVDITRLKRVQAELKRRVRQQRVVAGLGQFALSGASLEALFERTVKRVAAVLDVEMCKVLVLEEDGASLRLEAGVGWQSGIVGTATVPADRGSQAGYTLEVEEPVLVRDFAEEPRFEAPALLRDHDVVSGLSVRIPPGSTSEAYGVLGVHSQEARSFTPDDAQFVRAVANILAAAIASDAQDRELRESREIIEQHLAEIGSIYDTAPVGLAFMDTHLRFIRVNDRLAQINGVPPEDHIGREIGEVLPSLADQLQGIYNEVLETGAPVLNAEIHGTTPADPDTERDWIASYYPLVLDDETVQGINTVVWEVTEIKDLERQLREREEQYRQQAEELQQLYDTAPVGLVVVDKEHRLVKANQYMRDLQGAATVGRHGKEIAPALYEQINGLIDEALETGAPVLNREVSGPFPGPDDPTRHFVVSYYPLTADDGTPHAVSGVIQDVTEERVQARTLEETVQQIRALYTSAPVGLCFLDRDLQYVRVNRQMAAWLGREPDALMGARMGDHAPALAERVVPFLRRVIETGEAVHGRELTGARAEDQPPETWLANYVPVVDDAGEVIGVSVSVQDVSERKRQEEALRESAAELERLNRELEQRVQERTAQVQRLAADLTLAEQRERRRIAQILHDELQQQLYGLQIKMRLLRDELSSEQQVALRSPLEATQRLVEDAIHTARTLTVNLSPPILEYEGLDAALRWLAAQMRNVYGLTVEVDVQGPHPALEQEVMALLFQLVRELLFNIVKHAGVSKATVAMRVEEGALVVEVEDTGAGFDADKLVPRPEGSRASGLGLRSVRERLVLIGGTLQVRSHPGDGTSVTIRYPLPSDEELALGGAEPSS